jgi:hypothetical protein
MVMDFFANDEYSENLGFLKLFNTKNHSIKQLRENSFFFFFFLGWGGGGGGKEILSHGGIMQQMFGCHFVII